MEFESILIKIEPENVLVLISSNCTPLEKRATTAILDRPSGESLARSEKIEMPLSPISGANSSCGRAGRTCLLCTGTFFGREYVFIRIGFRMTLLISGYFVIDSER